MANAWFRLYAEFATDPKVQMLSETDQRRYIMLLCLRCNGDETLHDDAIAFQLRISNEEWNETKQRLIAKNLIDDGAQPINWSGFIDASHLRPSAEVWKIIRVRIFERDNYTCQYCGSRGRKLECDHVIPVSIGGSNDDTNLVTSCKPCNRSKHAKTPDQWRNK